MSEKTIPVTRELLTAASCSPEFLSFTAEQFAILGLPPLPEPGWPGLAYQRDVTPAQRDELLAIGRRRREIVAEKKRRAQTSLFE